MQNQGAHHESQVGPGIGGTYATPVLGVFLNDSGEMLTKTQAGERPRPFVSLLEKDHPPELRIQGLPISTLTEDGADGGDPDLATALGLSEDLADALKLAGQAISAFSTGIGAVGLVLDALKFMGLFDNEPNPYDILFDRINRRLTEILKATIAGTTVLTMQNIASMVAHAKNSSKYAVKYIQEPTPENLEKLSGIPEYMSGYALTALSDDAYWQRTYDVSAMPVPIQEGSVQFEFGPKVVNNLVWDWRMTLPAYLKVLTGRLAVLRALDIERTGKYRNEILGFAQDLRVLEQRIRQGFAKSLPIPDPGYAYWKVTARDSCGVVDMQSGASDISWGWTPLYYFRDPIDENIAAARNIPETYGEYLSWFHRGQDLRYWRLYDKLGLFALWQIIPDVEAAAEPSKFHRAPDWTGKLGKLVPAGSFQPSKSLQARVASYTSWRTRFAEKGIAAG